METVRLTVGQAIVRFLARQYVERDGREGRFIEGVWGIFGHGNVAGLGQALEELGDAEAMPYYRPQNEQAQVHLAAAFARHAQSPPGLCLHVVGGTWRDEHGHRCRRGDRQPHPCPAPPERLLRQPGPGSGPPADRAPDRARCERQRRLPAGLALLRPDLAAGAAPRLPAGGVPGPHRSGRDGSGDDLAARGRPVRGVRLADPVLREARLAGPAPAARTRPISWPPRRGSSARPRPRSSSWAAARSTPRRPTSSPRSRPASASRSSRPRPARAPCPGTIR